MADDRRMGLTKEDLKEMYRLMLLARRLDERQWQLNRMGQAPFAIGCRGHEGAQIGISWALKPGRDIVLPYYRDLGVVLRMGMTPKEVMLDFFAKAEGPSSGGRQMPSHYSHPQKGIVTQSSTVATQTLHAAGMAYAAQQLKEDRVFYTSIGEGSASQGEFHEALNWAGVYKLPVLFVVQNNQYAISVPASKQMAVDRVSVRAAGFGLAGVTVDGLKILDVYEAAKEAVERARRGEGATLLEVMVPRLTGHSTDDDPRTYMTQEEMEALKHRDPVGHFASFLKEQGVVGDDELAAIDQEVRKEVDQATDEAQKAADPRPEDLYTRLYATPIEL
ncbi:MAG: thiamine pyrophosphate-dependent dehydrogenase E1 component subunit alpha [Bacillota bacterium]|nr:thiamine pyrophosphate-dependent dehydrogenase E1 component subunit alpha [Bacillota bacterium]